jgi:hypothetical protein
MHKTAESAFKCETVAVPPPTFGAFMMVPTVVISAQYAYVSSKTTYEEVTAVPRERAVAAPSLDAKEDATEGALC